MKWVYAKWVDSSGRSGWQQIDTAHAEHSLECESLGFLIKESDDRITISAHLFPAINNCNDTITIPRVALVEFYEIELED